MYPVLILTKNSPAEQNLQQQLQQLNYDVYCSTVIARQMRQQRVTKSFFEHFSVVLLSETITNNELANLLPCIPLETVTVIRKGTLIPLETEQDEWRKKGISEWIQIDTALEETREFFSQIKEQEKEAGYSSGYLGLPKRDISTFSLSKMQYAFVQALFQSPDCLLSREDLCSVLWNEAPSASHLSQLSTLVKKLNQTFFDTLSIKVSIQTKWNQGYSLSEEFLIRVTNNESLEN